MTTNTSVWQINGEGEYHIAGYELQSWHYDSFSIYWVVNIPKNQGNA